MNESPESAERATPDWLFQALDKIFSFELDAAATAENAKCAQFLTKEQDALSMSWADYGKRIFLNPPYSKGQLKLWLQKAVAEAKAGCTVVCITPGDFGTQWFDICWNEAALLFFMRGRVKFNGIKAGAKFPSVIAVFGPINPTVAEELKPIRGQVLTRVKHRESWSIA